MLLRDLWTAYGQVLKGKPTALPELPARYLDFSRWQREQVKPEAIAWWKDNLQGAPPPLAPPHPRP